MAVCITCGAWAPACSETGYDADDICPACRAEGYDLASDGSVIEPSEDDNVLKRLAELEALELNELRPSVWAWRGLAYEAVRVMLATRSRAEAAEAELTNVDAIVKDLQEAEAEIEQLRASQRGRDHM